MKERKILEIKGMDITEVKKYLEARLATYGICSHKFEIDKQEKKTYLIQKISKKKLGIFSHALKNCELVVSIYNGEETSNGSTYHKVYLKLNYDHIGGGSNGCDLDIFLHCLNGKVYEEEE